MLCVIYLIYLGYGYIFIPRSFAVVCNKRGIKEYLRLTLPGLFQGSLEWWIFEIALIFSGFVKNPDIVIASTTVIANINLLCLSLALGASNAISIRVGKYIGYGSIYYAQRASLIGFLIGFIACFIVGVFAFFLRHEIPKFWIYDKSTIELASKLIIFFVFLQLSASIVQSFVGIYRSLGIQRLAAVFVIVSYYIVALPLAGILLFNQSYAFFFCFFLIWKYY